MRITGQGLKGSAVWLIVSEFGLCRLGGPDVGCSEFRMDGSCV
jgi:hypothetical protein